MEAELSRGRRRTLPHPIQWCSILQHRLTWFLSPNFGCCSCNSPFAAHAPDTHSPTLMKKLREYFTRTSIYRALHKGVQTTYITRHQLSLYRVAKIFMAQKFYSKQARAYPGLGKELFSPR